MFLGLPLERNRRPFRGGLRDQALGSRQEVARLLGILRGDRQRDLGHREEPRLVHPRDRERSLLPDPGNDVGLDVDPRLPLEGGQLLRHQAVRLERVGGPLDVHLDACGFDRVAPQLVVHDLRVERVDRAVEQRVDGLEGQRADRRGRAGHHRGQRRALPLGEFGVCVGANPGLGPVHADAHRARQLVVLERAGGGPQPLLLEISSAGQRVARGGPLGRLAQRALVHVDRDRGLGELLDHGLVVAARSHRLRFAVERQRTLHPLARRGDDELLVGDRVQQDLVALPVRCQAHLCAAEIDVRERRALLLGDLRFERLQQRPRLLFVIERGDEHDVGAVLGQLAVEAEIELAAEDRHQGRLVEREAGLGLEFRLRFRDGGERLPHVGDRGELGVEARALEPRPEGFQVVAGNHHARARRQRGSDRFGPESFDRRPGLLLAAAGRHDDRRERGDADHPDEQGSGPHVRELLSRVISLSTTRQEFDVKRRPPSLSIFRQNSGRRGAAQR